jgi:hypothetical protein
MAHTGVSWKLLYGDMWGQGPRPHTPGPRPVCLAGPCSFFPFLFSVVSFLFFFSKSGNKINHFKSIMF